MPQIASHLAVISFLISLLGEPLTVIYGAATQLKPSAETAAVSIEARHRL